MMFLKIPRRGEEIVIRGSVLRYVSMPGQDPHVDETDASRDRFWNRTRRVVAKRGRNR